MKNRPTARPGFTLLELLIVISIIVILAAALFPLFGMIRKKMKESLAKNTMNTLSMAMEAYRKDFNAYPPDDTPSNNGSEMIWYYLCRVVKSHELTYGPYIKVMDNQLTEAPSGGNRKFLSPLGGEYEYLQLVDADGQKRQYVLVDPGFDKKMGGSINATSGFVESDPKETVDNHFSSVQMSTVKK